MAMAMFFLFFSMFSLIVTVFFLLRSISDIEKKLKKIDEMLVDLDAYTEELEKYSQGDGIAIEVLEERIDKIEESINKRVVIKTIKEEGKKVKK